MGKKKPGKKAQSPKKIVQQHSASKSPHSNPRAPITPSPSPVPTPASPSPIFVFAFVAIAIILLLAAGFLFKGTSPPAPQENYSYLQVHGLVDSPADIGADEYYSYSLRGTTALVEGVVFKPSPCDGVKASAARSESGKVRVMLEFSERGGTCDEVNAPSKFGLSVDGVAYGDELSVTAGSRALPLNASNQFCGGIAAFSCPAGWQCKLDGNYPDAGGKCVKAA